MAKIHYGVFPDGQKWKLLRQAQVLGHYDTQELALEAGRMAARAEICPTDVQIDILDYYGELRRADIETAPGSAGDGQLHQA
jgi:hypothetical protein